MDYIKKYRKYKDKYFNLKKIILFGRNLPIGINYEGGKIIDYAIANNNCLAYANVQIGMDAPFHGEVASESVRQLTRSETQFVGYSDERLQLQLTDIFRYIINQFKFDELIIQIARGRSATIMEKEIIRPVLCKLNYYNYIIFYGYRSKDYFTYPQGNKKFIFVNIGMFARLSDINVIKAGDICNPIITLDILGISKETNKFIVSDIIRDHSGDKNILNNFNFPKIKLYGIADDMPFITPDTYSQEMFLDL